MRSRGRIGRRERRAVSGVDLLAIANEIAVSSRGFGHGLTSPVLHTAALVDTEPRSRDLASGSKDGRSEFHEKIFVGFGALRVDRVIGQDSPCRSEVSGEFECLAAAEDHRTCRRQSFKEIFVRRGYRATGTMAATRQSNACCRANRAAQIFLPESSSRAFGKLIRTGNSFVDRMMEKSRNTGQHAAITIES